jgi:hypothetical protein
VPHDTDILRVNRHGFCAAINGLNLELAKKYSTLFSTKKIDGQDEDKV